MNYNKKTVMDTDVAGKKILLRCDFNVPQDKETGAITSDKRIVAALPTIRYLLEKGAAVIACSHLGKPKGEWKEKLTLAPVAKRLSELLGQEVIFAADIVGDDAKAKAAALQGDIVSVDVGAYIGGFHGDCAGTYPCGRVSEEAMRLIRVTQESFFERIKYAREGCRLSDISAAVQKYVEANGFSVVREYVGHGIGRNMHESPEVPNYGKPGHGPRLLRGMTIAVEPMVNAGSAAIRQMPDGWTVKTADGKYAAHYENTVLITAGEPELLTVAEGSLV